MLQDSCINKYLADFLLYDHCELSKTLTFFRKGRVFFRQTQANSECFREQSQLYLKGLNDHNIFIYRILTNQTDILAVIHCSRLLPKIITW